MEGLETPIREHLRVLVVEDEPLVAQDIKLQLEDAGHQCVGIAADAAEALALAQSTPIDLALVDLNLRDGLTGPEIANVLVKVYEVPVLFATGNWAALEGFEGGLGILCKPFTASALSEALRYAHDHVCGVTREGDLPHGMIRLSAASKD